MKMLGWEDPFTHSICDIRQREVSFAGRMAQIRGLNLTLQFCMTPVVAFVTFSVYRAYGSQVSSPAPSLLVVWDASVPVWSEPCHGLGDRVFADWPEEAFLLSLGIQHKSIGTVLNDRGSSVLTGC